MVATEAYKKTREALIELVGERKLQERRRRELADAFSRWEKRAAEAQQRGDRSAAAAAVARCEEIGDQDAEARVAIGRLDKEIHATEAQLREIGVRESRSVDAEELLSALENAAGPRDPEKEELSRLERDESVDAELERLRKRIRNEGNT